MSVQAFVTGSTGMVGSNLIHLLIQRGYRVKALVRSPAKAQTLFAHLPGIEFVVGDLQEVAGFAQALSGCDVLFHTAAYFREYYSPGQHWQELLQINVRGTIALLEAAEKAGVQKAVYVSSSGVIGKKADGSAGDEATPPGPLTYKNLYFKSKLIAEQEISKFLEIHTLPVVLILPGAIVGPADNGPTAMGRLVLDYLHRQIPGIFEGGVPLVDARDVGLAMIAATEKGQKGERYLIGGEYYSMQKVFQTLEQVSGIPAPKFKIPNLVINLLARIMMLVSRFTGKPPSASPDGIEYLQAQMSYNSSKARQELGIQFRPLAETLKDTIAWYQQPYRGSQE